MDLPIEQAYADSDWDVERLRELPENWGGVRVLHMIDDKLTYVAHEKPGHNRFAHAYVVYGENVSGPFKHVEHLTVACAR